MYAIRSYYVSADRLAGLGDQLADDAHPVLERSTVLVAALLQKPFKVEELELVVRTALDSGT